MIKESENSRVSTEENKRLKNSNLQVENSDSESSVSKQSYEVISKFASETYRDDLS